MNTTENLRETMIVALRAAFEEVAPERVERAIEEVDLALDRRALAESDQQSSRRHLADHRAGDG